MVKKILFLLTFLCIFMIPSLQPKALLMGYPVVWYHENGTPYQLTSVTTDTWGGTPVYVGSNIGRISPAVDINRVDFNWYNANLCSGKTINVKGRLFGLGQSNGLFNENASLAVYNNNVQMTCSTTIIDQNQMDFNCYSDTGGGDLSVYMSTVVNYADNFRTGISRNLDVTCDVTNEAIVSQSIQNTQDIINNQNSNTNTITQNQNTNTQNIINNQDTNTQNIINNQNQNTQQEIESQKVCSVIDKSNVIKEHYYLTSSGTESYSPGTVGLTDYIPITSSTLKTLSVFSSSVGSYSCFYSSNKSKLSCINNYSSLTLNEFVTIPSGSSYFRATINYGQNIPQFELCTNGNQALNDSVNSLNDTLKSDAPPDTENEISDLESDLISDTPITDLITLPITLLNSYLTGFSGSCSTVNLGNLYGTDLTLPCLNLEQRLGSNLWTIIDGLFSIFMIYNIGMLMIQAFEGFTSLRDDYEGLYQPRHADVGYQPKHGGGN